MTMTDTLESVRSDTLPENTRYNDDGCELSSSCLDCPLPMCRYDDPGWLHRESRRTRDDEIFTLRKRGVPVPELARKHGISTRTVHRIIQRGGAVTDQSSDEDEGPLLTLDQLQRRSLFRTPVPFPKMRPAYARSA